MAGLGSASEWLLQISGRARYPLGHRYPRGKTSDRIKGTTIILRKALRMDSPLGKEREPSGDPCYCSNLDSLILFGLHYKIGIRFWRSITLDSCE
ncbi:hypothetical protein PoB_000366000 [Plakobranchus ocellatus]|uniref:Uncharacterized protein n=1 Tax=Plakobranchus ocellatus TaxID=259542 RepID=A0AAV3Y3B2_9GAST|nr:hypothetical protein PoB_000366000 [Plakobranchus ocellatus]